MAPTRRQVILGGVAVMAMKSVTPAFSQFLRLAFFRSPNYVKGVSGWTINQDGSVEFNNGTFRGSIVGGSLFLYNGAPAKGSLVAAIVPPGTTSDSFGNTVTAVASFGTWNASGVFTSGTHIDASGNISLTDATPVTRLYETPGNGAIVGYDPTGQAAGHHLVSLAANSFTDPAGNVIQRGLTAYGLSNPATQYAQLIGAALDFFDTVNAATSPGIVSLTTVTTADDALALQSPLSAASDIQSSLFLQRAATPGPGHAIIANADLNVRTNTIPAQPTSGFSLHSDSNGYPRVKVPLAGDTNDYFAAYSSASASATPQTISSTTATTITGCTFPVGIGQYAFRARVIFSGGAAAGTANFSVTGPANTSPWINALFIMSNSTVGSGDQNATGPVDSPILTTGNNVADIEGELTFTAAGTLALACAEGTAGDTVIIQKARFWLHPIL